MNPSRAKAIVIMPFVALVVEMVRNDVAPPVRLRLRLRPGMCEPACKCVCSVLFAGPGIA